MSAIKFVGKDPGGNAKAVNVDASGNLINYLSGSSATIPVLVTKSAPEYTWLVGGSEPTPTESFAWGVKFNATTGAVTMYGWSGSAWVEVL